MTQIDWAKIVLNPIFWFQNGPNYVLIIDRVEIIEHLYLMFDQLRHGPHITKVKTRILTNEIAQVLSLVGLVSCDIVVNPHSPSRVEF